LWTGVESYRLDPRVAELRPHLARALQYLFVYALLELPILAVRRSSAVKIELRPRQNID
jgi:hypothetical protein